MEINEATINEIKKLSISEKIIIVEEIWDSIAAQKDEYPELTEKQYLELNERIDSYEADPNQGKTWEKIKSAFWDTK